ncbi:MAG: hypothetical protein ABIS50_03650 [Luteolibacter sp.]|uniref:hypothetical protein n=1 Tax=Luteolibacter sp. TaxID=1962973 RepID=UPI0032645C80
MTKQITNARISSYRIVGLLIIFAAAILAYFLYRSATASSTPEMTSSQIRDKYYEVLKEAEVYAKNSDKYFSGANEFPKDDKLGNLINNEKSIIRCDINDENGGTLSADRWVNEKGGSYTRSFHLKKDDTSDETIDVFDGLSNDGKRPAKIILYKKMYLNNVGRKIWVVLTFRK